MAWHVVNQGPACDGCLVGVRCDGLEDWEDWEDWEYREWHRNDSFWRVLPTEDWCDVAVFETYLILTLNLTGERC